MRKFSSLWRFYVYLEIDDEKLDIPPCLSSSVNDNQVMEEIEEIIPVAILDALLPGIFLTTHPIIQGW